MAVAGIDDNSNVKRLFSYLCNESVALPEDLDKILRPSGGRLLHPYGPKIDVQVWSAIGREFTLATNQVDFSVPKKFDLEYTDSDGTKKTPLCIHRAPLGTHERFIGFLIEHYGGNFPLWLAPAQAMIIPVTDGQHAAAADLYVKLRDLGIRAKIDLSKEGFGKKIRQAKTSRAPYFIIIGDKDLAAGKVTLESRDAGQIGQLSAEEVIEKLSKEIRERK